MPPPSGVSGRVTVRLFLNENGDLTEVRVVDSSGKGYFDQSIVFATKQSNFPLPPAGATVADRTFLITYVYR
jgi:TonB family protein